MLQGVAESKVMTARRRQATTSDAPPRISENIKTARLTQGLSQRQLAEKCGWHGESGRVRIANYENDIRTPGIEEVCAIAAVLDMPPQNLQFGESLHFIKLGVMLPVVSLNKLMLLKKDKSGNFNTEVITTMSNEKFSVPSSVPKHCFALPAYKDLTQSLIELEDFGQKDKLIVDPKRQPKKGQYVLAKNNNKVFIFKKGNSKTERGVDIIGVIINGFVNFP